MKLTKKSINAHRVWSNARDLRSILEQAGKAKTSAKLIASLKRLEKAAYKEFKNAQD